MHPGANPEMDFGGRLIALIVFLCRQFLNAARFLKETELKATTKSFLIFGHSLALKVSYKFLNLAS